MMYVIKRDGKREEVRFDAILERITRLSEGLKVDPAVVTKQVSEGLCDGIKTTELDVLASEVCATLAVRHSDYSILAARIVISNLHKEIRESFVETVELMHAYIEPRTGQHAPLVSDELLRIVRAHGPAIEARVDHSRDYTMFDYFGLMTLQKSYLIQKDGVPVERPQHLFMRVALGIHGDDLDAAFETYDYMSQKYFTHATPTLFNAGTQTQQMSSCFLLAAHSDSIAGIYKTLNDCALISKSAGGIGVHFQNVRAGGSYIAGSRGNSDGIIPALKVYEATARYVNQGGKRKGSINVYLEPWHADVESFIDLRKNTGAEEMRARDLFLALWIPDLFMRRVEEDGSWTLMCPKECPGLCDSYGEKFEELYTRYERDQRGRKTVRARDLWRQIVDAQIETGAPFMLYKDAANAKSNQKNLGTIRGSNLCTEIIQYTSSEEVAVCNLASICVNQFVREDGTYDFEKLHEVSKVVCRNLNKVIDLNFYPVPEARYSNLRHRPMGIGAQGLADTFALMKCDFDSQKARKLNKDIFETIYHGAVEASIELAKRDGAYETFKGSPASEGQFQFDMWGVKPESGLWDWEKTRKDMVEHGLRNSLFLAPMPTASTAQLFGNNESIEAFSSNLYVRRTLSGDFIVVNKHLVRDLQEAGLWDDQMRTELIAKKGSVQTIERIPEDLRSRYRTSYEMSQKPILEMAADRGAFICQSTSLNIHMRGATASRLTSLHFAAWKLGLKTGMYYLRNTPAVDAVAFTVDNTKAPREAKVEKSVEEVAPATKSSSDDPNVCISCGS